MAEDVIDGPRRGAMDELATAKLAADKVLVFRAARNSETTASGMETAVRRRSAGLPPCSRLRTDDSETGS
jgi:hypothetical protein